MRRPKRPDNVEAAMAAVDASRALLFATVHRNPGAERGMHLHPADRNAELNPIDREASDAELHYLASYIRDRQFVHPSDMEGDDYDEWDLYEEEEDNKELVRAARKAERKAERADKRVRKRAHEARQARAALVQAKRESLTPVLPPALPAKRARAAEPVEPDEPASQRRRVDAVISTPLAPVAARHASPIVTSNVASGSGLAAPLRQRYSTPASGQLNIPGLQPLARPVKRSGVSSLAALSKSLVVADDDDDVLAALQQVGLRRKATPAPVPVVKDKGKGRVPKLESPAAETADEVKALRKAERKEAKRLAREAVALQEAEVEEEDVIEETPAELKARRKAEKKEAKRLAREAAAMEVVDVEEVPIAKETPEELKARLKAEKKEARRIARDVVMRERELETTDEFFVRLAKERKAAKLLEARVKNKAPPKAKEDQPHAILARQLHGFGDSNPFAEVWHTPSQAKEVALAHGITLAQGKFTFTEMDAIGNAIETFRVRKGLSEMEMAILIQGKKGKRGDAGHETRSEFWSTITRSVQGRTMCSIFNYVRRITNPLGKQGKWLEVEDDALLAAVKELGNDWKNISTLVHRTGDDCRVRYTNFLMIKNCDTGPWTEADERLLLKAMIPYPDTGKGHPWLLIAAAFVSSTGGKRTRNQIRDKWVHDLSRRAVGEPKIAPVWSHHTSLLLVSTLLNMRVKDPSEINWQKLGEPELDKHGSRAIRTRWKDMLADTLYNLGPQTTLQEMLEWLHPIFIYLIREGPPDPSEARTLAKRRKLKAVLSNAFITESDDESEEEGPEEEQE